MGDEVRVVSKPGSHRCRTGGRPEVRKGGEEGKDGGERNAAPRSHGACLARFSRGAVWIRMGRSAGTGPVSKIHPPLLVFRYA